MTKEEIEKQLRAIVEAAQECEERLFGGPVHHDVALPNLGERILRADVKLCMSLLSQAYEEAARADCYMCAGAAEGDGTPPAIYLPEWGWWAHVYESADGDKNPDTCRANGARKLMASLSPEPVASS